MSLLLIWQQETGAPIDCIALASGNQFLIDCVNYFAAYDLLGTELAKAELQRDFLLAHGARWIKRDGIIQLVGGEYPVRWCIP